MLERNSTKLSVTSLNHEGKFLTNNSEIANAFNMHFVSVGPNLADEIKTKSTDETFAKISDNHSTITNFKTVDTRQILVALTGLKNGKASGPDKIPVRLAKDASEFIALPFAVIYNSSLTAGNFPDIWNLTRVSPIFKSGARGDMNN